MTRDQFHAIWDKAAKKCGPIPEEPDAICIHNGVDDDTINAVIAYGNGDKSAMETARAERKAAVK